jgi:hypothetical protein
MASSYNKVAGVIGEEMDKAWKNIMERLSTEFFKTLGGARLAIDFSSLVQKGETTRFSAHQIIPNLGPAVMIEGSISIGVAIKF